MIEWVAVDRFQADARLTLKGQVQAGFFLAEAYVSLTRMTRSQLHVLVESRIGDISHGVLASPRMFGDLTRISQALLGIGSEPADGDVLEALGIPRGFEPMTPKDAEFMTDLMDTLLD